MSVNVMPRALPLNYTKRNDAILGLDPCYAQRIEQAAAKETFMAILIETKTHILGGYMPVIVIGRVHPAEPDVGCGECPEIDEICWANGKPIPTRMWKRLLDCDIEACEDALLEAI
jgi:hypothetical protein